MISTIKRGHFEGYLFGPIVLRCAKYHVELNFSCASCFPTGNDSSKGHITLLDAASVYLHFIERVLVDEVLSTASVHEHFSKPEAVHDWTKDQCGGCSGCSEFGFITGIEGNSRVTPRIYSAMWQILAMLRSVRLHLLFDAKVSKTVNTVFLSTGWCFVVFGRSRSSPLLATCRSIQHALRLCVGIASAVL